MIPTPYCQRWRIFREHRDEMDTLMQRKRYHRSHQGEAGTIDRGSWSSTSEAGVPEGADTSREGNVPWGTHYGGLRPVLLTFSGARHT